jgi:hypothetical protein
MDVLDMELVLTLLNLVTRVRLPLNKHRLLTSNQTLHCVCVLLVSLDSIVDSILLLITASSIWQQVLEQVLLLE